MSVEVPSRDTELSDLRETVRLSCERAGGTRMARALPGDGPGYDVKAWDLLAVQVGLAGVGLPEEAGGVGGGLAEIAVICEELGRVLAPVPFLSSTVLAGQVLARCGAAATPALEAAANGQVHALVFADPDGVFRPDLPPVTARAGQEGTRIDGRAPFVLDGAGATAFVVAAAGPDGVDLALVDRDAPGVEVRPMATLDLARSQAAVTFSGAPAVALTSGGTGGPIVSAALDVALVALAAEQLGGAEACLSATVAHVRERRQFGRAIGSFQAVKHRCADMLIQVETARSAVERAVLATTPAALAEAAAVAKAWCGDAFGFVAAESLQLHGGMGFTWEHDAHLYLRRARADAVLFGGTAHHRERLARLLGW